MSFFNIKDGALGTETIIAGTDPWDWQSRPMPISVKKKNRILNIKLENKWNIYFN